MNAATDPTAMKSRRIAVLLVEDSATAQPQLSRLLEADPQIAVIGVVNHGEAALNFIRERTPDAIVMDLHRPEMDGFEATRRIMETQPVPIIICAVTESPLAVATTFRGLEAGAVACVEKPRHGAPLSFEAMAANLLQTVKLMSEVKVVRRWPRSRLPTGPASSPRGAETKPAIEMIGIGASTGGPPVLQTILAGLPKDFPAPILIVQHIARGFLPGLMEWLNQTTGFKIQIGAYGIRPLAGQVYLAPDGFHMGLSEHGRLLLTKATSNDGLCPAVASLFRSLAEVCGPAAVGVLLTGMGRDGAAELKLMKDQGSVTIAQDAESSVVHGMPGAAIKLNGATHILPADRIAEMLLAVVGHAAGKGIDS